MSNKDLVSLASIISAGLITSDEYIACCDEIILTEDEPSELIMDLSLIRDEELAVKRLLSEAYGNFGEDYPKLGEGFFQVCASYLRYQSGGITWEEFLRSAVLIAEHDSCQWSVSDFSRLLVAYMENGCDAALAKRQSEHMAGVLKEDLEEIRYYQELVRSRNLTRLST